MVTEDDLHNGLSDYFPGGGIFRGRGASPDPAGASGGTGTKIPVRSVYVEDEINP